jgi:hypothetical protein
MHTSAGAAYGRDDDGADASLLCVCGSSMNLEDRGNRLECQRMYFAA